jgi:serine/threonine protein kinase
VHSQVYRGILRRDGSFPKHVAVKVISPDSCSAAAELSILQMSLDSPFVCAPWRHVCTAGRHIFVSDLLDTSLRDVISRGQPFLQDVALGHLMQGLSALHSRRVLHGDLKADNLMFQRGVLKIIDFGLSKALEQDELCSDHFAYAYPYKAPEVAMGLRYGTPADVWAMGMVGLEMATREYPPFCVHSDRDLLSSFEAAFELRTGSLTHRLQGTEQVACLKYVLRPAQRTPAEMACLSMASECLFLHPQHRARLPPASKDTPRAAF